MLGLGLLSFLKFISFAFFLYSVATSLPNMSHESEKIRQRMQTFPRYLVRFLLFYGGEWDT